MEDLHLLPIPELLAFGYWKLDSAAMLVDGRCDEFG
jgi:hypothetical protein